MRTNEQRSSGPNAFSSLSIPWGIHRILPLLLFLVLNAQAQDPVQLWSFDTRDASFGQTAAGDIDGDGKLELVFGCYRNDSSIYALNAEDGSLLWKFNAAKPGRDGCNDVATLIVDIDGDDIPEVIVPSSCNPTTFCFDGKTGVVKWSAQTRGSDSPPTIADIDGDGKLEILHGEFGGWVRCLNAEDGSLAWDLAVDTRSWIQTAPTLLDADGDGNMDFVVATWNSNAGDTNTIRAYRCSDRAVLWSVPLADVVYHGTAIADFDRDGKPELAIGDYSGTLYVLNAEDGSIAWTKPSHGAGHYIGAPVSAGDINGDGNCELIAISWYKVTAYNGDGSMLWEHDIDGYGTAFRGAALADVDGDGLPDAVFGTSNGLLIALRGTDGALLWSVDLAGNYGDSRFELDHAPIIADLDKDGKLDVFIVGGHTEYPDFSANFGRAYALSIGRGTGPEWLMFQQNYRRSTSLCAGSVNSIRISTDERPTIPSLFPQPVGDVLNIVHEGLRVCRILDEAGRTVANVDADGNAMTINVASLPSAVYFLVLEVDGMPLVRSFIKR